jgi:hypothetical protein
MIMGMITGFGCFLGVGAFICIAWKVACGLGCSQNTSKVAPADFRAGGGRAKKAAAAAEAKEDDSTSSRRQLNDGARGDFRDY